ncbi:MAG: ribokinase [Bryobacterales bacterium]|nr:ribokinase [Bryobacterales bacterium]
MTTAEILARFPALSALVIGDICLDRWCTYDPATSEASRETGIPRIGVVATEITAGAGGTVANNLVDLGCGRVAVLGVVGDDGFGFELRQALARRRIDAQYLVDVAGLQTFTYTKLLNSTTGEEDLPRVDFITTRQLSGDTERRIVEAARAAVPEFDVILVSDQAETAAGGVVTPLVRDTLAELALEHPEKVFWVDSRMRAEHFRNMIVKPNEREAREACERVGAATCQELRRFFGDKPLIVTHGGDGAEVWTESGRDWVAARRVEHPVDICGAGDSFSAGAALTMAVTGSAREAARMGNRVASITIMKKGTGTATPAEVLATQEV